MAGLVEKKKREVRDKIIMVAGDLFDRQGFEDTTMDQIATEAVVARKTLYNYFSVKEAIAEAYIREISKGLAQTTLEQLSALPDIRSRLITAITSTYHWAELHPELTRIVMMYRLKNLVRALENESELTGTQGIILEILRQGQEAGEIRPDIPANMILSFIDCLRSASMWKWLKDDGRRDLCWEISNLVDLVLDGARVRPGRICDAGASDKEG